jgi:glycogen operon protein
LNKNIKFTSKEKAGYMKKFKITNGKPYPLGATVRENGVNFSMVNSSRNECGIVFYKKGVEQKERILFDQKHRIGNICCVFVEGLDIQGYEYNFFIGDKIFVDPYAKRIVGNEKWRQGEFKRPILMGGFDLDKFDWQGAEPLHIPYSDSIMYCLNVRNFTRHSSSKVKKKGTFEGLIEKIPYLKELGINAIELMPVYEFEECEWASVDTILEEQTIEYQIRHIDSELSVNNAEQPHAKGINCWGYKEAYYFAPKASFAASADSCEEFRRLVREMHKNGIEVIMQFYFPENVKQGYILEIIKHWVLEYFIDGVHLKGTRVPVTLIATEPLLANTKIMCEDFYLHEIYPENVNPANTNKVLGYYRDEFMYDMRKFLKGDQNMLGKVQFHMKNYNPRCGVINYITNYYGFTLNDLVSYEKKHNEANGENNADGTDFNFSWNCGAEGSTRKKTINQLRHKQMKNALTFVLTAQGTPLIYAGDEFGNSQSGNNNCYCQDNEIGWVDWRALAKNNDIFEYTKNLIEFRKKHNILHLDAPLSMLDKYGCGYPDLSYHGGEAWKAQTESYNRHIGIMYCSKKADENEYIYIAYNMHWDTHRFALPSIGNCEWSAVIGTDNNEVVINEEIKADYIDIKPRSISILVGKKCEAKPVEKKISPKKESVKKEPVRKAKKETAKKETTTKTKKRKYVRKEK